VGSATISLRQGAVDLLESDSDDDTAADGIEGDALDESVYDEEVGETRDPDEDKNKMEIRKENRTTTSPRKRTHGHVRKTFKDLLAGHQHPHSRSQPQTDRMGTSPSTSSTGRDRSSDRPVQPQSQSRSPVKERSRTQTWSGPGSNGLGSSSKPVSGILHSGTGTREGRTDPLKLKLNRNITLPSSSTLSANQPPSQQQQRRRTRANSLHFPSGAQVSTTDKNFYLSHYSTDREYSLEPPLPSKGQSQKPVNLSIELGLGDDFDHSFGEAMRRGLGGEELPLPQQALRVLSEAKENMDLRLVGKQGRKGSLGMGLFKESREREDSGKKKIRPKDKEREKEGYGMVVPEEDEEALILSDSASASASASAGPKSPRTPSKSKTGYAVLPGSSHSATSTSTSISVDRDTPLPPALPLAATSSSPTPRRIREKVQDVETLAASAARIQIVSSPLLRDPDHVERPRSEPESESESEFEPEPHVGRGSRASPRKSIGARTDTLSSESGWTTTDSEDSSSAAGDARSRASQAASGESASETEDEGESMTVPLQPFNHAVGGHSSIYKFTRRAVCKVSIQTMWERTIAKHLAARE